MIGRFVKYYRPHWKLFALDIAVAVSASALSLLQPYLTRELLKKYIPNEDMQTASLIILAMLLIYFFDTLFSFIRIKWGHFLGVRMEFDMREDIFSHIQKLSFTYFDNVKTGHIMSRISNDLNMIAEVAHHAPEDFIISILLICGAFIFMFHFSASLALVSLIPLPIMLLWGAFFGRRMKEGFRQVRKRIADINSTVENSVQGIREVKSFANEELEINKFNSANISFRAAKEKMYSRMAVFHSGMQFWRGMYYLVVIAGGCWFIYKDIIEVSDLLAFVLYVGIILPPIDRLTNFIEQFQQGTASFERFIEIMDIEPDIQDVPGAVDLNDVKGKILVSDVTFSYKTSPSPVVKKVTFTVEAGSKIALVGESGAGKSTIVSLIPRFYEPSEGAIFIDDIDIAGVTQESLRKNTGLVQQNVFLFDASIRENIMYGNPFATESDMIHAASSANIYDFIQTLPSGFDTEIGERGVKLSGGQRQRVSIARVFLKNPPILIFDEATSSLDTESEALIHDAMMRLSENRTTIIIAHRLSTVKHVDRIFVLKQGEIVEEGTHDSLMDEKGYYHSLYVKNLL